MIALCTAYCHGQELVVESISIIGLSKTKEDHIRQYLNLQQGDKLDSVVLEANRQRLANLEILGDVQYRVYTTSSKATVEFHCKELSTLLPIFNFGGLRDNFWFRVGASESNLMGMGKKLTAFYQYYDRSSVFVNYSVPRMPNSRFGYNASVIRWATLEPLYFDEGVEFYDYDNNTYGISGIYHFDFNNNIEIGGAYFEEHFFKKSSTTFGPSDVRKQKLLGKIIFKTQYIKYQYFYLQGWDNTFNFETVATRNEDVPFYIVYNDTRFFKRIGIKANIGVRFRTGLSTNNDSPFAPFVLDSYINIRGSGNKVNRGTGTLIMNMEYRYTLIDKKSIALQGVVFSDIGSWRLPGGDFNDFLDMDNLKTFVGGGARLIYKKAYNAILRIDYGVNVQYEEERGFVLGLGQYF